MLVGGVLMASSLVELYFSYRETQRAIVRVERAKAVAAAAGIEQFLKEVEQQVRETTRTASDDPDASQVGPGKLGFREGLGAALAEQRELDFLRVLRNVPAVSELSHLDLAGKEQLRVSRLDPDVVGSQAFDMARKLYVGNLPYDTGEQDLESLFAAAGTVESVSVMRDMATGRARGFAFVEMGSDEDAQNAISQFNNYSLGGRNLTVNEARPKPQSSGGYGGGGGGGGKGGRRREPRW